MIGIYDLEEKKFVEVPDWKKPDAPGNSGYPAYHLELPELVMAPDGLVYRLSDNGACGDPECCGDFEQYYKRSDRYIAKEIV